mgnify:CR=1 FL=1
MGGDGDLRAEGGRQTGGLGAVTTETDAEKEPAIVENARARSNDSAQPDGGAVTGRAKDK